MEDELILDDSPELEEVIPEPETAPEEIQDVAQFYKGDPFKYSDFTPEQLEALKVKGDTGRGIASIDLTNTTGKVKTYTITFTDDTTTTFTVVDGNDGASPEITFVGTTIYVNGVAGPDLKGATGKSQYQSYLDTTSDNPPLSEAEWSKAKNIEYLNFNIAFGITSSFFWTHGHYNFFTGTATSSTNDAFIGSCEGYFYKANKSKKIKRFIISFGYLSQNNSFNGRISVVKHNRSYNFPPSAQVTNQIPIIAKDIFIRSTDSFDLTSDLTTNIVEENKYLSIGVLRGDSLTHSFCMNIYIEFEDV